jgi:predicted transcriptional regulator
VADKGEQHVQVAIRVPESVLERVDRIADKMSQPGMRVTRTDVLRLATYRGVEQLEAEQKKR